MCWLIYVQNVSNVPAGTFERFCHWLAAGEILFECSGWNIERIWRRVVRV